MNLEYYLYVKSKNQWYKWTYLQTETDLTDIENNLVVTKGEVRGWGINQELGMNAHTLLYIRQKTNKDLLYSTRNSTECSVVTYMRKKI